ncbi:MAG: acetyl/propionyl/methylcrotonyl-CoA carboxylase subunit alpha [Kiloniellales bacterium]|nr:acetyl/propionyl/methylcrotonyl-CoA carboxylase subunit alpha [Kiloniellales bacterium]
MFASLLIANRGEIACRIIRTARRMGLRTVAVYSEADRGAQHVALADEGRRLGPAPAAESYLRAEAIIEAAVASGAEAIHPGYGFLSENADFAEACEAAGLAFVGPPASAIRAMGSKSEAKTIMEKAGVPLVPGYHGADQDPQVLAKAAAEIGFPVLIKASAGGGGKGMRVVEKADDFEAALAAAQREAAAAFGDDRVLIEKYLTRPRHIEVQVFADSRGEGVHLFERDCSLQRRHQKVIEEAPAPGISEAFREALTGAAVTAAQAIGYRGAGTVEFIVEGEAFYFMEMNTRLQVEHPVTECITGQDLVEWQLRVAAGEPLPLAQDEISCKGHAFEARLYAEDPQRDFLPATGRLSHLRLPADDGHLRVDTGVAEGDEVSVHYDPMIAKVIAWDEDRAAALRRLRGALARTQVVGLTTNLAFLAALAGHPAFAAEELDTGFIPRHRDSLLPEAGPLPDAVVALACLAELERRRSAAETAARRSADPHSPWFRSDGWRLNVETHNEVTFLDGDVRIPVTVHYRAGGFVLDLPGGSMAARANLDSEGRLRADLGDRQVTATVVRRASAFTVFLDGRAYALALDDPWAPGAEEESLGGRLTAPMPGKITQLLVASGAEVKRGAPILILEAMKMEHTIAAPADGRIEALHYAVGDLVEEGAELLAFEATEG